MRAPRRKLKRKASFIFCCLVLLALIAGGCMLAKSIFFPDTILNAGEEEESQPVFKDERLNVLLLGIDARRGETMARTDTIILASVDLKSKQMSLLSIPRDTRVNIPKHGWDKINSAAVYGGPQLTMKVVSDLLGIPVKHYVLTNFSGFKEIVDALGGVTIDVERNMYHEDITDGGIYRINLKKGLQRLDGDKALQYVRFRDYELGDIDRTKYQQKFLVALAKEMLQPSTIPKLPKLVPEINRYVDTNLSISDMLTLASAAKQLADGNIVCQTLPGRPLNIDEGSYWGVDPAEARQMVTNLFNGVTTSTVVMNTPLSGQYAPPQKTTATTTESSGEKKATQSDGDQENPATPANQAGQGKTSGSSSKAGKDDAGQEANGSGGLVTIKPVGGKNKDDKNDDKNDDNDDEKLDEEDSKSNEIDQDVKDDQKRQDDGDGKNTATAPGSNTGTDTVTGTKDQERQATSPSGLAITERTYGSAEY